MSDQPIIVAIDGPSASGKSTIARLVAEALNFHHVDTGSMYRAFTWKALEENVSPKDLPSVVALLDRVHYVCDFVKDMGGAERLRSRLDGEDPSEEIRTPRVEASVSLIAAIPEVRDAMVKKQQELAQLGDLVMEGRDIGTVVFPETPFKFYIDASPEVRARRRAVDQSSAGREATVGQALAERDRLDSTRKMSPLKIAEDAIQLDTSELEAQAAADIVLKHIRSRYLAER